MATRQLELVIWKATRLKQIVQRVSYQVMAKRLRVVVNRTREAGKQGVPFPVTSPVDWIHAEYQDNKPAPDTLRGADVFVGTDFTKQMGHAADSLRAILIPAAGYDRIDPDAIPHGCVVANAYHHEAPIAEWIMAVAVALDHDLFRSETTFRAGSWEMWPGRHGAFRELYARTFGIIGFGAIGRRVAKLANAYEMHVIAAGRNDEISGELHGAHYLGGGKTAREKVLQQADFVLVSTPLSDETHGLIGKHELSLMKESAYIINPARGHVIKEDALYHALKNNSIAGAAIDTWYRYPEGPDDSPRPSDFPFWELDNIIMTPHHSGATHGTFTRRGETVAQNIDRLSTGQPLLNVIAELSRA